MTKEEAVKVLKPFKACMFDQHGCPISDVAIALDVAIEALESTRWIPVSERPPEADGDYLVTLDFAWGKEIEMGWLVDGEWLNANGHAVVAWMQKPKPWEGEIK